MLRCRLAEAVVAMRDQAFARVDRPQYVRDVAQRLREHLAQFPEHAGVAVTATDLVVSTEHATVDTAVHWAVAAELKALLPDASVFITDPRDQSAL